MPVRAAAPGPFSRQTSTVLAVAGCGGLAHQVWADSGIGPVVPVIQPSREKAKETPLVVLQHVIVASEVTVQANSPLVAVCPTGHVRIPVRTLRDR